MGDAVITFALRALAGLTVMAALVAYIVQSGRFAWPPFIIVLVAYVVLLALLWRRLQRR